MSIRRSNLLHPAAVRPDRRAPLVRDVRRARRHGPGAMRDRCARSTSGMRDDRGRSDAASCRGTMRRSPVGFVLYVTFPYRWSRRPVAYLLDLYVDDAMRGRGVGAGGADRTAGRHRARGGLAEDFLDDAGRQRKGPRALRQGGEAVAAGAVRSAPQRLLSSFHSTLPSTPMCCPVIRTPAGEARKAIIRRNVFRLDHRPQRDVTEQIPAHSPRPKRQGRPIWWRSPARSALPRIAPGRMAFTRTPCGPSSRARLDVRLEYARLGDHVGQPQRQTGLGARRADVDDQTQPCAFMSGITARAHRKCPVRLTPSVRFQSSSETSSAAAVGPAMPALCAR